MLSRLERGGQILPRVWPSLLAAAFSGTVAAALATALWMAWEPGGGRVHDSGLIGTLRFISAAAGFDPDRLFPESFQVFRDLSAPSVQVPFLFLAVVGNLGAGLAAVLVLFALLAVFGSRLPAGELLAGTRPSEVGFPIGVGLLFFSPAVVQPAWWYCRQVLHLGHWGRWGLAASAVLLLATWWLLSRLCRDAWSVERFFRRAAFGGQAVTGLLFLAAGSVWLISPMKPAPADPLPNILVVSIDSLRHDHLSSYGYSRPTSPNLDALAAEGARFETVVSSSSWTLPAHMTLLASLPARVHQVRNDRERLTRQAVTMAEALSEAGYQTAGFAGGSYLRADYGFFQGFDHYDDYTVLNRDRGKPGGHITSPMLVRLVKDWLDGWDRGGRTHPFFIFLHMWDVHFDFKPPAPYDSMFDPDYEGTITSDSFARNPRIHRDMDPRDLEHIIALYDGEIRFTDEHLGEVFDELQRLEVFGEMITVVTSDHGDEFFEHGKKGHRNNLYDNVLLVPLIMRYPPEIPAGRVIESQVRLLDVGPTVFGLAGIEPPREFGYPPEKGPHPHRNLVPLIRKENGGQEEPIVAFSDLHAKLASVRTETTKMVMDLQPPERVEVYDLTRDPGEQTNLYGRDPLVDQVLAEELASWVGQEAGERVAEPMNLDPRQAEVLRSLGYLK